MNEKWILNLEGLGVVRISDSLLEQLAQYRQLHSDNLESGGILLGKHLNSNGALLIDGFTPPQSDDKQGRNRFYRSKQHNALAEKAWKDSNGHITYVGLWHSHPEPSPTPSTTDYQDWRNALRRSRFEGNYLFFFIVGQTHIRCWTGQKRLMKCEITFSGEYEYGK